MQAAPPIQAQAAGPLLGSDAVRAFGPTLVIAPHADDESLGCGGALALLAALGLPAHVLVLTDGTGSHPSSRRYPPAALRDLREHEALAAVAELGLPPASVTFLRLPDTASPRIGDADFAAATTRVVDVFRMFGPLPATVLVPWRREPHRDHRSAWELIQAASARLGTAPRLIEYPIWLWELGAPGDYPQPGEVQPWRLDVRAVLARKRAAIAAHRSQTTALIDDAPDGFRLSAEMLAQATGPWELFFEASST